ncbi:MAG: Ig-like domain repeat protein, partial [Ilumatobacter sp.]|nr:Ig-like domain repeat protein [Ilumatobacter sp.]
AATSVSGEAVTASVTVAAVAPGAGTPTGSVEFFVDGASKGTATLAGGTASLDLGALALGARTITASYAGDGSFKTATGNTVNHTVGQGATTTAVVSSVPSSVFGQSVTFTATVTATGPATGTPGGTVTFKNGAATLGTGTLSGGTATLATATLPVGTHTITAEYGGEVNFTTSVSAGVSQTVDKADTTTTVSLDPAATSVVGQTVKVTITVSSAGGIPAGTGELWVDGRRIRANTFNGNGQLGMLLVLPAGPATVGPHTFKAVYVGDDSFKPSSSADVMHAISKAGTQTALAVSKPKSLPDEQVTLTATVTGAAPSSGPARGGHVLFTAGGRRIGLVRLESDGTAALTTDQIPIGTHQLEARYRGSAWFTESTSAAVQHQVTPLVGPEFRVNTQVAGDQELPAIAAIPNAGHVVVWTSDGQDSSGKGVFGQRYDLNGAPLGGEFPVNTTVADDQNQPAVTAFADGSFAVTWTSNLQDGDATGIYAQRFDAGGAKVGGETLVNTTTTDRQAVPAIVALDGGGYAIAWQSRGQDGSALDILAQIFDAAGNTVGGEIPVNTTTDGNQVQPAVTSSGNGFVVAWRSIVSGTDSIYAREITSLGVPIGGEVKINDGTATKMNGLSLTRLSGGKIAIGWSELATDGTGWNSVARFVDPGVPSLAQPIAPAAASFVLHRRTAGHQTHAHLVAFAGSNELLATWASLDGDKYGVLAQRFGVDGLAKHATDFQVNTFVTDIQAWPAAASKAGDTALVTWTSEGQDSSLRGVYAQRLQFIVPPPPE